MALLYSPKLSTHPAFRQLRSINESESLIKSVNVMGRDRRALHIQLSVDLLLQFRRLQPESGWLIGCTTSVSSSSIRVDCLDFHKHNVPFSANQASGFDGRGNIKGSYVHSFNECGILYQS